MISERIKAALPRGPNTGLSWARAAAALRKAAMERAEAYRVHIEWALSQLGTDGKQITFRGAGEKLNELHHPRPDGWPLQLDERRRYCGEAAPAAPRWSRPGLRRN